MARERGQRSQLASRPVQAGPQQVLHRTFNLGFLSSWSEGGTIRLMDAKRNHSRNYRLVSALPYPSAEKNWLLGQLNKVPDEHQVRGLLLQGNEDNLRKAHGESAVNELAEFMAEFGGSFPMFGWVPARDYFLLNARLASFWCTESYTDGVRVESRAWFTAFANNPIATVIRTGMLENMDDILVFQCQAMARFYNFGDPWSEKLSDQHLRLYYDGCHGPLLAPMAAGVVDGLFELAGLEPDLGIEVDEESGDSVFDVRW